MKSTEPVKICKKRKVPVALARVAEYNKPKGIPAVLSQMKKEARYVSLGRENEEQLYNICELLELLAAGLVVVGVVLAIVGLFTDGGLFLSALREANGLNHFVERVFAIVIGIEFLQMLTRPNTDNVIGIIIFLVARHMIVGETTPVQNLISIFSLTILIILRWMAHDIRRRRERADGKAPNGGRDELE